LILHYIDINFKKCQWEDIILTPKKTKQFEDITFFYFALRHTFTCNSKHFYGMWFTPNIFFLITLLFIRQIAHNFDRLCKTISSIKKCKKKRFWFLSTYAVHRNRHRCVMTWLWIQSSYNFQFNSILFIISFNSYHNNKFICELVC
jgi:hypothetical protein